MSTKRRRPTFGMHHLTVVPRNAERPDPEAAEADDERRDEE